MRLSAPSPAVAPPPGNPRFPLFDSLRAIAVLAVVTFHVTGLTGASPAASSATVRAVLGSRGLILFFVISGFLLYRPFVAARCGARHRSRHVAHIRAGGVLAHRARVLGRA